MEITVSQAENATVGAIRVLHCDVCKRFTRHTFKMPRVVAPMTVEDLYVCPCGRTRRYGLSISLS